MKLLATRMMANNRLGRSSNLRMSVILLSPSASASLSWAVVNEKKATSAPDIRAEAVINPNKTIPFNHMKETPVEIRPRKSDGSGSNNYKF